MYKNYDFLKLSYIKKKSMSLCVKKIIRNSESAQTIPNQEMKFSP
jgi:hypothetical protein